MTAEPGALAPESLAVLDAAPCGLFRTADDGTFIRVNRTFCAWLGYSTDELIGRKRFQELLTMGGRIFHQTHWSPLLRMQGTVSEVKLKLTHADGTLVPMVVNAIRREEHGTIVHDVAAYVARDRDKYERELIKARKDSGLLHAEAKDRALLAEQMIGIVSHDLRNPLSTVAMATALLRHGALSPSQERAVGSIERAGTRATRLIADLLDFTRARLGTGLSCTLAPIDLHEVVAEAVEELRVAYPQRELRHVRSGDARCSADAERVVQLLGNLVSNAMSYGRAGAPVTVSTHVDDGGTLVLAVHNEGDPIPEAIRAGLFEPMTRGPGTAASTSVGLGLFIVRELAKAHGGTVDVRSSADEGTTFAVRLPPRR